MAFHHSIAPASVRAAQLAQAAKAAKATREQEGAPGGGLATSRIAGAEGGQPAADEKSHVTGQSAAAGSRATRRSGLSSRAFASSPKTFLGHLLASGDRLRHRAAARMKDADNTKTEDLTFFESKVTAATGGATAPTPSATGNLSTATTNSTAENSPQSLQNPGEHSGQHPQQHLLHQHEQNALHSVQQQQPQQPAAHGQGEKQEVHTRKLVDKSPREQSRQTVVNQQRLPRNGTEEEEKNEDICTEEQDTTPAGAASRAPAGQKEQYPRPQKAVHFSEYSWSTSTTVHRRSSSEDAPKVVHPLVKSPGTSRGGLDISSGVSRSRPSWCSLENSNQRRGTEHGSKRGSTEDDSSNGEDPFKDANVSRDTGEDESDTWTLSAGADNGSIEEGCVKPGIVSAGAASAYAPGNIFRTCSRAGRPPRAPADIEAEGSLDFSPGSVRGSDDSHHLDGGAAQPLLALGIPGGAAARSPPSSSPGAFVESSCAASVATSPGVSARGRFKKGVGMRLSEMLLHGRGAPKLGSAAKDGTTLALRDSAESRTMHGLAFFSGADTPSPSHALPPSPFGIPSKLASPLLLRQLRRRALREQQRRAAAPDGSRAPTGGASGVRDQLRLQDEPERGAASLGPAAAPRAHAAGERTGEAGRSAGVLRGTRVQTKAGKGGDGKAESCAGGGGTALHQKGGRRLSSSDVSDTSADGGGGQVKTVRFGSMSVHLYAREARIRSCSSDSLNFDVALDPAASSAEWRRACDIAERSFAHGGDDFDDAKAHAGDDDDDGSEEEDDEEEYEERDDEEGARGYQERLAGFYRAAGEGRRAEGAAAAQGEHGLAAGALSAAARPGLLSHGDGPRDVKFERRITGPLPEAEEAAATAARATDLKEAYRDHSSKLDSSDSFTLERYPSAFEDMYGKPDTVVEESDERGSRWVDMPLALHCEQPTRGVAIQACAARVSSTISPSSTCEVGDRDVPGAAMEHRRILEREHEFDEQRAAGVDPVSPIKQRGAFATACAGFRMHGVDLQRGMSLQIRPGAPADAAELPTTLRSCTSATAESTGAGWWRRVLSNSSSETEDCVPPVERQQRRTTEQEQADELERRKRSIAEAPRDVAHVVQAGQVITTAPVVAACVATGGCSAGNLPVAGEAVCHDGGVSVPSSLASSPEQQRLKSTPLEEVGQEETTPGQETGLVRQGNDSDGSRTRTLKALFQKQIGWPEVWMQSRSERKSIRSTEKGRVECTQHRELVAASPRRIRSDEYSTSGFSSTQPQRRQSEGALRFEHGEKEIQPLQLELKSLPIHSGKEAVPSSSGRQADPVHGTGSSSPLCRPHPAEHDSHEVITHGEHQRVDREKQSLHLADVCLHKNFPMESHGSSTCMSCSSTLASSDLESKSNSLTTAKDLPVRSSTTDCMIAELLSHQDVQNSRECNSATVPLLSSSVACLPNSQSPRSQLAGAVKHPAFADAAAQQYDMPHTHQQQLLLQQHSLQQETQQETLQEDQPPRRQAGSRGSLSSMSSTSRSRLEEEMTLSKAAEEVLERSSTTMSAEEKETLRGILRGWCS